MLGAKQIIVKKPKYAYAPLASNGSVFKVLMNGAGKKLNIISIRGVHDKIKGYWIHPSRCPTRLQKKACIHPHDTKNTPLLVSVIHHPEACTFYTTLILV